MNKPLYLGLSLLDLNKTVMYELQYDYVKTKSGQSTKLCHLDTDSFIVRVKTKDIYKGIGEDVETTFNTSNFVLDRPLPKARKLKQNWICKR